jgi:hypothetical protein
MNKVVYNSCYGGFSLSNKAINWLLNHGYQIPEGRNFLIEYDVPRHHPLLVQCVEELGEEANGECSELKIKEIEEDHYRINDYDGMETVETLSTINWIKIQ